MEYGRAIALLEEVCEAVQMILEKGPDAAMNVYNGRKVEKA